MMDAIKEINRYDQMNEIFLFCKLAITFGWNVFYFHLLITINKLQEMVEVSPRNSEKN